MRVHHPTKRRIVVGGQEYLADESGIFDVPDELRGNSALWAQGVVAAAPIEERLRQAEEEARAAPAPGPAAQAEPAPAPAQPPAADPPPRPARPARPAPAAEEQRAGAD